MHDHIATPFNGHLWSCMGIHNYVNISLEVLTHNNNYNVRIRSSNDKIGYSKCSLLILVIEWELDPRLPLGAI